MPRRFQTRAVLLALAVLAAAPGPARAADPLLSGYGGPGSGEQVILGGGQVGGGGGSSGAGDQSLRATASAAPSTSAGAPSSDTSATPNRKPSRTGSSTSSSEHEMTSSASTSTSTERPAGAPPVVAYPTRAGAVGGLPLSLGQTLLMVLGVALLALAILGLRRLSDGSGEPPSAPQVSVR